MYLQSEDEERDLIEQAIQEAQIAEQEQTATFLSRLIITLKSWFTKNDHVDPSPNVGAMS